MKLHTLPFQGLLAIGRVDLIHTPVVGLAPLERARIEGGLGQRLPALVDAGGRRVGIGHGGLIRAEVHIVVSGLLAGESIGAAHPGRPGFRRWPATAPWRGAAVAASRAG